MAVRKRPASEINFEASLQKLETIVKRLEEEEIPLEASLKLFAEGQALARACEEQLRAAENQIRQLLEKSGGKIEEEGLTPEPLSEPGAADEAAEEDEKDEGSEEEPVAPENKPAGEVPPVKPERKVTPPTAKEKPPRHNLDELPF